MLKILDPNYFQVQMLVTPTLYRKIYTLHNNVLIEIYNYKVHLS